jgi:hypothetical protein
MKQINYNDASVPLEFRFPAEWDANLVTDVTLQIKNMAGTEILAAESVTLYTATTLDADAARYADEIVLDSGAGTLKAGQSILVKGVEADEVRVVKGFNTTSKAVKLESLLDSPHDEDDAVIGLFCTHSIDTTTVADYPKGDRFTLIWTPIGSGMPSREIIQVSTSAVEVEGLRQDLKDRCPRAYEAFTVPYDRFDNMLTQAENEIAIELSASQLSYDRIVDQDLIRPTLIAKLAFLWTQNGDDNLEDERLFWSSEYGKHIGFVINNPIWTDTNQDDVEDEIEVTSHEHIFDRSW